MYCLIWEVIEETIFAHIFRFQYFYFMDTHTFAIGADNL